MKPARPPITAGLAVLARQGQLAVLAVLLVLASWAPPATAQALAEPRGAARGEQPVALESPAWLALMAEPLQQEDNLAYHAAETAGLWGHPDIALNLRLQLLVLHGQALGGAPVLADRGLKLGDLDLHSRPSRAELQAAWDEGLNRLGSRPAWDGRPPVQGLPAGAQALPGLPGFWRLPQDRLGVQLRMVNGSPLALALPGPLGLQLQAGIYTLALACAPPARGLRWPAGGTELLWCQGERPMETGAWAQLGQAQPRWRYVLPNEDAAVAAWVELMAGRPSWNLSELIERAAQCKNWPGCRTAPNPAVAALVQQRALDDAQAKEAQVKQRHQRRENASALWLWAGLIGGFAVFSLVARFHGVNVATFAAALPLLGITVWLLSQVRFPGGWGDLGLLILGLGSIGGFPLLLLGYRRLYLRFLAPR